MEGVFLKNEGPDHVQVQALGAFFDFPTNTAVQVVNPFRGKASPNADLSDDQVAEIILAECRPAGGSKAAQNPRAVVRLTDEQAAALIDDDTVLTEKEQAAAQRRKARKPKRAPKRKASTKRKKK